MPGSPGRGTSFPGAVPVGARALVGSSQDCRGERIILRVAWRVGCVYEWGHHVHMATELGVGDEEIGSLAQPQSASWDRRLRTLVQAADELVDRRLLSDKTWDLLREHLSEDQAIEFCMLVGHYVMVAGTISTLGVRLEPGYLKDIE